MYIVNLCFKQTGSDIDDIELIYPASTVLLDLTANDTLIEELSVEMRRWDIYAYILQHMLPKLLNLCNPSC